MTNNEGNNKHNVSKKILIGAHSKLTINQVYSLNQNIEVGLNQASHKIIQQSHEFLKSYIDQRVPIYGINTQFGDQVSYLDANINNLDVSQYLKSINLRQENLIKSHSCGLGNSIPREIIRAAMTLRAHCLAQGYSGVSLNAIEALLAFVNADITPIVRTYGSIGASGDLIPLAMIAAAIIGENVDVLYEGKIVKAPEPE